MTETRVENKLTDLLVESFGVAGPMASNETVRRMHDDSVALSSK